VGCPSHPAEGREGGRREGGNEGAREYLGGRGKLSDYSLDSFDEEGARKLVEGGLEGLPRVCLREGGKEGGGRRVRWMYGLQWEGGKGGGREKEDVLH